MFSSCPTDIEPCISFLVHFDMFFVYFLNQNIYDLITNGVGTRIVR